MHILRLSALVSLLFILISGCSGKGSAKKDIQSLNDNISVPDTGYTGIKQYYNSTGDYLIKEVTFKNGVRHGEMKTFYKGGQKYQSFWYEKGLREDSARWFYPEGQIFRSTPYKHDTIDGIQRQYYRNGRTKARIGYIKGFRTPDIEEYTLTGKLVKGYPEIVTSLTDNYQADGKVRINLGLSDKSTKVKFYRGEFYNGVFDTSKLVMLKTVKGQSYINLKKAGTSQQDNVGVIAEITTDFGNKYLAYKKTELPYKDLK